LTGSTLLTSYLELPIRLRSGRAVPKDLAALQLTDMQSEMSIYLRLLAFYVCLLANIQVI